ncbi:MAG: hypothetical protein KatS3mg111_3737 [Pirellulaceae bacterium]|nr:MAG: hypothetical protein KatS3mg111_3737 [Pirellulaceae bacterium]
MVLHRFWSGLLTVMLVASAATMVRAQDAPPEDSVAEQAYLGLGVAPVPEPLVAHIREIVGDGRGVLVAQVMKDSPAEKAGVRTYDVIVRYNDQDVYAPEQLVKLVRHDRPGNEVTLELVRGGKLLELKAQLAAVPTRPSVRGQLAQRFPRWQQWPAPWQGIFPERIPQRPRAPAPNGDARKPAPPPADADASSPEGTTPDRGTAPQDEGQPGRTPWKKFESMTVTKLGDGRYKVEINYVDADEKQIHREYVGTREEIKQAIDADKELPDEERQHLLRTLDMQERPTFWFFPDLELFERELFNWPNLDF